MAANPIRVLIADDHPVVRIGLRNMLQADPHIKVIAEAKDGIEALHMVRTLRPDILLLDLAMPKMPGMEALREMTGDSGDTRTIVLTGQVDKRQILEALQLGARGVVLKDAVVAHLSACIRAVMQGQYWLEGRPVQNLVQVLRDLDRANRAASAQNFWPYRARIGSRHADHRRLDQQAHRRNFRHQRRDRQAPSDEHLQQDWRRQPVGAGAVRAQSQPAARRFQHRCHTFVIVVAD